MNLSDKELTTLKGIIDDYLKVKNNPNFVNEVELLLIADELVEFILNNL